MEKCLNCGKEVKQGEKYCSECGADLSASGLSGGRKNFGRDIIIILGGLAVVIAGYFLVVRKPDEKSTGFKHPEVTGMNMADSPDFDKIIADLPKNYDSLVVLGNGYMDHGIYPLAIECYRRALDIDSTDPNVLIDYGACRYAIGEDEPAIEQFEKALAIDSNHAIGYFNMGIVYRSLGNREKALQYWGKVVELQPGTLLADTAKFYIDNYKPE